MNDEVKESTDVTIDVDTYNKLRNLALQQRYKQSAWDKIKQWLCQDRAKSYTPHPDMVEGLTKLFPPWLPKSAHVEAEWTTPCHWSHDNYERAHLPQLCIKASGWKARILAAIFRAK